MQRRSSMVNTSTCRQVEVAQWSTRPPEEGGGVAQWLTCPPADRKFSTMDSTSTWGGGCSSMVSMSSCGQVDVAQWVAHLPADKGVGTGWRICVNHIFFFSLFSLLVFQQTRGGGTGWRICVNHIFSFLSPGVPTDKGGGTGWRICVNHIFFSLFFLLVYWPNCIMSVSLVCLCVRAG